MMTLRFPTHLLSGLLLTAISVPSLAFESHNAEYEVFWGDRSVATLAVEAKVGEKETVLESKLNAHGIAAAVMPGTRTQTSKFLNTDTGLQQTTMLATRSKRFKMGKRGSREEEVIMSSIEFDHASGKATATEGDDTATLDVTPTTADRQSLILLVADRWKTADAATRKKGIPYSFVNGVSIRDYSFREVGEEQLETSAGTFTAVKLVHGSEDEKHTVIWLAKELGYFPIGFDKARPRDKGVSVNTRISVLPSKPGSTQ